MKTKKIFSVLLSLICAVALWAYVVNNVATDDTQWVYNIPVNFINEDGLFADRNFVLSEGSGAKVSLRFYGNRREIAKLNNTNVTVSVDLSQITEPGEWNLPYTYDLPETVTAADIKVEARSVTHVSVTVDKLAVKEVEVRAVFKGDVAEGYVQEAIKLQQESVEVSGPRELVESVSYAQVVLERTNLTKSVSDNLTYTFMNRDDEPVESEELRCDVDKIGVEMPVYMIKEVPLTVELIAGGGATSAQATYFIDPAVVSIKGDPAALEGLNSLSVGKINLAEVQKSVTETFSIVIPDGMSNLTGDTADVTVELLNLKTKTFSVSNIELTSRPEDFSVTLGTKSLTVQIRGLEEEVKELSSGNIRAVADLAAVGGSTGQYLVPVEVYVDGFSNVGAMGTYSVLVTISEVVETAPVEVSEVPTVTTVPETTATPAPTAAAAPVASAAPAPAPQEAGTAG